MKKNTIPTILGTVICLAALAAWFFTAPAVGSGWILLIAFIGALGLLNSIRTAGLATVAGVIITAGSGAAWWFHRELPNSVWVLCLCVLCAIGTFQALSTAVSDDWDAEVNAGSNDD